jgi:Zn-dependent membrane protease YugP
MPGFAQLLITAASVFSELAQDVVEKKVEAVYAEAKATRASCGWMGWQVARHLLDEGGAPRALLFTGIPPGHDHYDPDLRTVRLADEVWFGTSVFAVAVAAHEAGHAIQHATDDPGYLAHRDACKAARRADTVASVARVSGIGWPAIPIASAVISRMAWNSRLRVELDASARGIALLHSFRLVADDQEERLIWHTLKAGYATYDIR